MPIAAYCWPPSVVAGQAVTLRLSGPGGSTPVEVARDGARPEVAWRADSVTVVDRALPDDAPEAGCGWPAAVTVQTAAGWRSGCYLVRTGADAPTAWFVVRPPRPTPGAALLKLATNTWNAYNDVGGRNLYTGAVHASFERPLAAGLLAKPAGPGARVAGPVRDYLTYTAEHGLAPWHAMAGWAGQERRFAVWAERNGLALDYATDADVDAPAGRSLLDGYRLVLSVGHDEYWTWAMRDAVEGFVADGGNVAFLSGNTCYWQVRLEDEDRRMVAWKHRFAEDPVHGTEHQHRTTTVWSDPLVGRPENTLTGVSFTRGGYHRIHRSVPRGAGGYEVHRPGHWLLAGTDLRRGDLLGAGPGVVGQLTSPEPAPKPAVPTSPSGVG